MSSTSVMTHQGSSALVKSTFINVPNGTYRYAAFDSCVDSSGNVYTLTPCQEAQYQSFPYKFLLQKTKSDGTVAWSKVYYQGNDSNPTQNYPFIKCIDDNYLIFGGTNWQQNTGYGYVSKLNASDGSVVWGKNFSNNDSRGYRFQGCHIDASKNIYVQRYDSIIGPIVYKLDYDGNIVWTKALPTNFLDPEGVTLSYNMNNVCGFIGNSSGTTVYIGQWYANSATAGGLQKELYRKQSTMVFCLNSSGNLVYLKFIKGYSLSTGGVTMDESGNVILTGYVFWNDWVNNYYTGSNQYEALIKLDTSGNCSFYKTGLMSGTNYNTQKTFGLTCDKFGNIYKINIGANSGFSVINYPQAFITKYDSSGNLIWSNYIEFTSTYPSTTNTGIVDDINSINFMGKSSMSPCYVENNKLIIPMIVRTFNSAETSPPYTNTKMWNVLVKIPTNGSKLGSYLVATYLTMNYAAQSGGVVGLTLQANTSPVIASNTASLVSLTDTVTTATSNYTASDSAITLTNYVAQF